MSLILKAFFPIQQHDRLLDLLRGIQGSFAPIYFSTSERISDKRNVLSDKTKFGELKSRSKKFSFTLIGERISYHISPKSIRDSKRNVTHGTVMIELKRGFNNQNCLPSLLHSLLRLDGVDYGFICEFNEYSSWHRHKKVWPEDRIEAHSSEFLLGVNYAISGPGLYWITAFSETYASSVGLPLNDLSDLCVQKEKIERTNGSPMHVFQFFDASKSWPKESERLKAYASSNEALFQLDRAKKELQFVKSKKELMEYISHYP